MADQIGQFTPFAWQMQVERGREIQVVLTLLPSCADTSRCSVSPLAFGCLH